MRKSALCPVSFTPEEKIEVMALAKEHGLSTSEYCRQKVLGVDMPAPKPKSVKDDFRRYKHVEAPIPVGGLCQNKTTRYDWTSPKDYSMCASLCLQCPVLDACKTYRDACVKAGVPLTGVLAGVQPRLSVAERHELREARNANAIYSE
jgi:hypothetical protein